MNDSKITFLYTNIGRGHPFYLDGIADALVRSGNVRIVRQKTDVFELSSFIPRLGWQLARWLYVRGSSGGAVGNFYRWLRTGNNHGRLSLMLRIMGADIRRKCRSATDHQPLLVAHPTLVRILHGRPGLVYQHGEVVAPEEALVTGADIVSVPTDEVAKLFTAAGCPPESVFVSGLCIEPALVLQSSDAFDVRLKRLQDSGLLSGTGFSSGAEPLPHIQMLVAAAVAAVKSGHRMILFARQGGRLERAAISSFAAANVPIDVIDSRTPLPSELPMALLVLSSSRREEDSLTARLFPNFDFFLAPSHERSNWALGLGLPMFIIEPCIGPYAPLNQDFLLRHRVAERLVSQEDAAAFGRRLEAARAEGHLLQMARSGWGRFTITGFERIAGMLADRFGVIETP